MTSRLPESANVLAPLQGAKLHAPSAARNADALCRLLKEHAPETGAALEIASGTGQHVVAFARATPGLVWRPTEIDPVRRASIDAYRAEANLTNLRPAAALDATVPGWSTAQDGKALIVLVNLLHLIPEEAARTVVTEALAALSPRGRFILYGPFLRDGRTTSAGDAQFHQQLAAANPAIGYKDDRQIQTWLGAAGATSVERIEMPANNLAFVAQR
jgi:hypothetical protein